MKNRSEITGKHVILACFFAYMHFFAKKGKKHLQNKLFGATITNGLFSKGEK